MSPALLCCWAAYLLAAKLYLAALQRWPPGAARLCAALPLVACALGLPFLLTRAVTRGSLAFIASWLTAFKALAGAAGRGPLAASSTSGDGGGAGRQQHSDLQQAALLLLPLTVRGLPGPDAGPAGQAGQAGPAARPTGGPLVQQVAAKLAAGLSVILLLHAASGWMPGPIRHLLYAVIVWLAVSVLLDGPSSLLAGSLGLALEPAMDQPLRSASLAEFWGTRYNRAVSAVLRCAVYEPMLQLLGSSGAAGGSDGGRCGKPGSGGGGTQGLGQHTRGQEAQGHCWQSSAAQQLRQQHLRQGHHHVCAPGHCRRAWWARAAATLGAFAASGIMHELCTWHMCQTAYLAPGAFLPGRHLLFFVAQAPLVLLEKHLLAGDTTGDSKQGAGGGDGEAGSFSSSGSNGIKQRARTPQQRAGGSAGAGACPSGGCGWRQVLRGCGTLGVLLLLAELLFWPPLEACRADVNGIAELSNAVRWAAHTARRLLLLLRSR